MSGALGTVARVAGIAGVANDVLGLIKTNVYLGDITFSGIQVPEQITWGGSQRLVRHVAPGGVVVLSSLGIDYPTLGWSGVLEGASATFAARRAYLMMVRGAVQQMSWLDRSYTVVVREFLADDQMANWIPYRITVDVLYDNLFGPPRPGDIGIVAQLLAALNQAQMLADVAQTLIEDMQAVLGVVSSLKKGDTNALALQADNSAAVAQLRAERARQDAETNRLALQASPGALLPVTAPGTAAANVLAAVASTGGAARAAAASGRLDEFGKVLEGASA